MNRRVSAVALLMVFCLASLAGCAEDAPATTTVLTTSITEETTASTTAITTVPPTIENITEATDADLADVKIGNLLFPNPNLDIKKLSEDSELYMIMLSTPDGGAGCTAVFAQETTLNGNMLDVLVYATQKEFEDSVENRYDVEEISLSINTFPANGISCYTKNENGILSHYVIVTFTDGNFVYSMIMMHYGLADKVDANEFDFYFSQIKAS